MLLEILNVESINVDLGVHSKEELLERMLDLALKSGNITNPEKAMSEILQREKIMSTGIGDGLALPHAKTNAVSKNVGALAILSPPINYEALDDKPVNIVFLLLSKENNVSHHLKLLSSVSKMMNDADFKKQLINSKSANEVIELIKGFGG